MKKFALYLGVINWIILCISFPLYENHLDLILEIMTMSAFGFCEMQISLTMTLLAMKKDNQGMDWVYSKKEQVKIYDLWSQNHIV